MSFDEALYQRSYKKYCMQEHNSIYICIPKLQTSLLYIHYYKDVCIILFIFMYSGISELTIVLEWNYVVRYYMIYYLTLYNGNKNKCI